MEIGFELGKWGLGLEIGDWGLILDFDLWRLRFTLRFRIKFI
jgi:hypothetical protein